MRHIILISGKDSLATALVQRSREPFLPYEYVHNPTGWDLPETLEWLGRVEKHIGKPLVEVGDDLSELVAHYGILPTAMARFCTREAKIVPLRDFLGKQPATVYYGLRADEPERAGYVRKPHDNILPRYPLREIGLGLSEVWRLCQSHDLLPPTFYWAWMENRVRELLGERQFLVDQLEPWEHARLFAWRSRNNCDRCFNAAQYEKIGLYEFHPDRFEASCVMEETTGANGYTWHSGYSLRSLIPRADEIKERRARQIARYLESRSQRDLFAGDPVDDVLSVTSCGLLCGK